MRRFLRVDAEVSPELKPGVRWAGTLRWVEGVAPITLFALDTVEDWASEEYLIGSSQCPDGLPPAEWEEWERIKGLKTKVVAEHVVFSIIKEPELSDWTAASELSTVRGMSMLVFPDVTYLVIELGSDIGRSDIFDDALTLRNLGSRTYDLMVSNDARLVSV